MAGIGIRQFSYCSQPLTACDGHGYLDMGKYSSASPTYGQGQIDGAMIKGVLAACVDGYSVIEAQQIMQTGIRWLLLLEKVKMIAA